MKNVACPFIGVFKNADEPTSYKSVTTIKVADVKQTKEKL